MFEFPWNSNAFCTGVILSPMHLYSNILYYYYILFFFHIAKRTIYGVYHYILHILTIYKCWYNFVTIQEGFHPTWHLLWNFKLMFRLPWYLTKTLKLSSYLDIIASLLGIIVLITEILLAFWRFLPWILCFSVFLQSNQLLPIHNRVPTLYRVYTILAVVNTNYYSRILQYNATLMSEPLNWIPWLCMWRWGLMKCRQLLNITIPHQVHGRDILSRLQPWDQAGCNVRGMWDVHTMLRIFWSHSRTTLCQHGRTLCVYIFYLVRTAMIEYYVLNIVNTFMWWRYNIVYWESALYFAWYANAVMIVKNNVVNYCIEQ